MSTPGQALVAKLRAAANVVAIVDQRIYRARLPQPPTFPAIVVQLDDDAALMKQTGLTRNSTIRPKIFCIAKQGSQAEDLAQAVKSSFNGEPYTDDDTTLHTAHAISLGDAEWPLDDRLNVILVEPELWARGPALT